MGICDLHMHTSLSDGELSPVELIEYVNNTGMKKFSITDHDNVDVYFDRKVKKLTKKYGMSILHGCEFICKVENTPIEILGYGINVFKARRYLKKNSLTQNKIERLRSELIPTRFKELGYELDYDASKIDFSLKNPKVLPAIYKSVLNNKELKEKILAEDEEALDTRNKFLRKVINNDYSSFFVNLAQYYPEATKIIDLIHKFGGVAVLAHPLQYMKNMNKVLNFLKDKIDGVECWHYTSYQKEKGTNKLLQFCKENSLLATGGSDFHRLKDNEKNKLGEIGVSEEIFDILIKK